MDSSLGEMVVRIGADTSGLTAGISLASHMLTDFSSGNVLGGVALGLAGVGAAAVATGAKTVSMAGNFQAGMTLLETSAGELHSNLGLVSAGLLQMAVDTGTSTDELQKGMFNVESAGYRGAQALMVEKAAAEGAKVENADLAAITDVLTTSMHNYNMPASQAVDTMNSFRMAASIGKMRMDDLTGALRNVLPIASQAKVSLTDVEAALSTMSLAGDKGASAGTHLSQMLTYLLAPSSKATKALTEVGLTTQQISDEMKVSLPGAVQMITEAVGDKFPVGSAKYIAALSAIVGGNKSMKAMLELSGISLKTFTQDAEQLAPTMKANATAVDGWTAVQGNFNLKMDQAREVVEVLGIKLGTALIPDINKLLDAVTPVLQGFSDWITGTNDVCTSMDSLTGFVMTITGDIETFGSGIADAIDKSGLFQSALQAAKDILPEVGAFLLQVGSDINQNVLPPLESLITNVGSAVGGFITWADKSGTAKAALADLEIAIGITTQVVGTLVQGVSGLIGWFAQGGIQTKILIGLVGGLGVAFATLKIADTVENFKQMFAVWSEGDGILSNLASSIKDKLAKAIDDFISNQFPNLKTAMGGVKTAADEAATAEEEVAAAPADTSAEGWFARLEGSLGGVGTAADEASTQVGTIGVASETSAGEVAASSTEMEASLEGVGTAATGTETAIAGVGTSAAAAGASVVTGFGAVAAGIMTAGIGAIIGIEGYMLKDAIPALIQSWTNADFKPPMRYEGANIDMRNEAKLTADQVSSSTDTMKNNVTLSAAEMYKEVVTDMTDMQKQSIAQGAQLSTGMQNLFNTLSQNANGTFSQMSNDAYDYLKNVEDYVSQAQAQALQHQIGGNAGNILNKNFNGYAEGGDVPSTGLYRVGEKGPEIVALPGGSHVYPHGVYPSSPLQGGMSGSKQPTIENHTHIYLDSQEIAHYAGDQQARMVRLHQARRVA